MLGVEISSGAIYFGKTGRRLEVLFNESLRHETHVASAQLREIWTTGSIQPAKHEKKCAKCSLLEICMPRTTEKRPNVSKYIQRMIKMGKETGDQ
jgi:CRISPR-associated exonuclease Cas4